MRNRVSRYAIFKNDQYILVGSEHMIHLSDYIRRKSRRICLFGHTHMCRAFKHNIFSKKVCVCVGGGFFKASYPAVSFVCLFPLYCLYLSIRFRYHTLYQTLIFHSHGKILLNVLISTDHSFDLYYEITNHMSSFLFPVECIKLHACTLHMQNS